MNQYARLEKTGISKPEKIVIIHSCLLTFEGKHKNEFKNAVLSSIHWDTILKETKRNGTHGILYHHLKKEGLIDSLPPNVFEKLQFINDGLFIIQEMLYEEVKNVLQALKYHGVVPMALKGLSLSKRIYKDIYLRPSSDIDLLIRKEDWKKVNLIFSKLDFLPVHSIIEKEFEINYVKKQNPQVIFEVSTGLSEISEFRNRMNLDRIWNESELFELFDVTVRILSKEDELLYLIFHHLNTHYLFKLIWLCDLIEWIRLNKDLINWDSVLVKAIEYKLLTGFRLILYLAENLADIKIILNFDIKTNPISWAMLKNIYNINELKFLNESYLSSRKNLIRFLLLDGEKEKVVFLIKRIFPHHLWLLSRYKSFRFKKSYFLLFFYHQYQNALQLLKLIKQYLFLLVKLFFRIKSNWIVCFFV